MNINDMRQSFDDLMTEIEGLDQAHEDYASKIEEAEALKAKIEAANANAEKLEALKQSANSFPKSNLKQSIGVQVKEAFTEDPKLGFENKGEFLASIAKKGFEQDNRIQHILQTSGQHTTTNDGLMIPAELMPEINVLGRGLSQDIVSLFDVKNTNRNSLELRRVAATTRGHASTGLVAGRAAEVATFTASRETFELDTVKLDKLYVYSEVSEEDLEDFAMLEGHLTETAPELLRIQMGIDIISGNGVGRNLGFTQGSDYVTATRTTSSTVKADDIANMLARHIAGPRSFWLVNHSVWNQLPLMSISNQPVYQNDFTRSPYGSLMGLPVYTSEDCAAMGTTQDIMLVNPDGYCAFQKVGGMKFNTSMHVKFDQDLMAFKWTMRFGGIPKFNAAYTPRKGSTLSHFVALTT